MLGNLRFIWATHRFSFIAAIIGIIFVFATFILTALSFLNAQKHFISKQHPTDTTTLVTSPLPKVQFSNYKAPDTLPQQVTEASVYQLKNNLSIDDIQAFAQKLTLSTIRQTNSDYILAYDMTNLQTRGVLSMNKKSGAFTFTSFGSLLPEGYRKGQTPQNEALSYLQNLGLADATVTCKTSYQSGANTFTYVVCHRDAASLGLPDLSLPGILNHPSQSLLASQSFDTATNENSSGNTVTVAIRSDGTIQSIDSQLRFVTHQDTTPGATLLTPDEALQKFQQNQASIALTVPDGQAPYNWQAVYANNQATAQNVTITDMVIAYLENPMSSAQRSLTPMYVIRGTTTLTSGYNVWFAEALPALKSSISLSHQPAVAGANSYSNLVPSPMPSRNELQLQTFTPTPVSVLTRQPSQSSSVQTSCVNVTGKTAVSLSLPNVGTLIVPQNSHAFYEEKPMLSKNDLEPIKNMLQSAIENQYIKNVAVRLTGDESTLVTTLTSVDAVKNAFMKLNGSQVSCPQNLSTSEPTAPLFGCNNSSMVEQIANAVSKQILTDAQTGKLQQDAVIPDLFPQTAQQNLEWQVINFERNFPTNSSETITACEIQ